VLLEPPPEPPVKYNGALVKESINGNVELIPGKPLLPAAPPLIDGVNNP
jgi:hypothetical protein